jgi:hypothetical protein
MSLNEPDAFRTPLCQVDDTARQRSHFIACVMNAIGQDDTSGRHLQARIVHVLHWKPGAGVP